MAWAEAYWERTTLSSFAGHSRLFEDFPRAKRRLRNREEVDQLLAMCAPRPRGRRYCHDRAALSH